MNIFILITLAVSSGLTDEVGNFPPFDASQRKVRSLVQRKSEPPARPNAVPDLVTERPYFTVAEDSIVVVQIGKTAYLNCNVNNIADKSVSWFRKKDFHILSADTYTYSRDMRLKALHQFNSQLWTLMIEFTKPEDAGFYECQVNSEPMIKTSVELVLVEVTVEIVGAPDLYVKTGSTIELECRITNATITPTYVFWRRNNKVINYDNPRDWVSVKKEGSLTLTSTLRISSASKSDSGIYTCEPSFAETAQIRVNIINGENPAAMQSGHQNSSASAVFFYPLMLSFSLSHLLHCLR